MPPGAEAEVYTLIRSAAAKAGTVGFASNTLDFLALPANLARVSILQINLIQDIARVRGCDLHSKKTC